MALKRELKKSERTALYVLGAAVLLVLLWTVWLGPMRTETVRLRKKVLRSESALEDVRAYKREYLKTQEQIDKYREIIIARSDDFSLAEEVTKIENRLGFRKVSAKPSPEQILGAKDEYLKQTIKYHYTNKTLEEIVKFLYEIENPELAIMIEDFNLLPSKKRRGETFDIRSIKLSVVKLAAPEEP